MGHGLLDLLSFMEHTPRCLGSLALGRLDSPIDLTRRSDCCTLEQFDIRMPKDPLVGLLGTKPSTSSIDRHLADAVHKQHQPTDWYALSSSELGRILATSPLYSFLLPVLILVGSVCGSNLGLISCSHHL